MLLRPCAAAQLPPPPTDERCGEALAAGMTASQLAHYHEFGFVVLRSLYDAAEVEGLRAEFEHLLAHRPVERGSAVDAHGALVPGSARHYNFTDPVRGDDPRTFNTTKVVLNRVNDPLSFAPAIRTAYGSPKLLACASSLYGPDVVPFGQSLVLKPPHDGAGFSFHQDTGISADFPYDWQDQRGVNFGIYLHPSTAENGCLHVVPGSQRTQKDIATLTRDRGAMLPGAVPVPVNPGDAIVHSRNVVHGSFPNTSDTTRCTLYFGFHPHASVASYHDEESIRDRQRQIPLAVALRSATKPDEQPFRYRGLPHDDPVMQFCDRTLSGRWKQTGVTEAEARDFMPYFDGSKYPNLQI